MIVLRPGDVFGNHLHERSTESLIVMEGMAELWVNRVTCIALHAGNLIQIEAGEEHFVRNISNAEFRAIFVKAPWIAQDNIDKAWTPPETS